MSYNTTPINNVAATANIVGSTIDTGTFPYESGNVGVQITGTGLNTADSTVKFEHSNDGVNFDYVYDADGSVYTITMALGTSTQCKVLINMAMGFIRPYYEKGTNSAGTIKVIFNFL